MLELINLDMSSQETNIKREIEDKENVAPPPRK